MSRKVITPCEGLLACFTLKWTFIGVAAKMSRKASTHCEGLLAYITLQRIFVGSVTRSTWSFTDLVLFTICILTESQKAHEVLVIH
jgi:hypothetical protein